MFYFALSAKVAMTKFQISTEKFEFQEFLDITTCYYFFFALLCFVFRNKNFIIESIIVKLAQNNEQKQKWIDF